LVETRANAHNAIVVVLVPDLILLVLYKTVVVAIGGGVALVDDYCVEGVLVIELLLGRHFFSPFSRGCYKTLVEANGLVKVNWIFKFSAGVGETLEVDNQYIGDY